MTDMIAKLLTDLAQMQPNELRANWRSAYRSTAPDIAPELLRRGIAYRIQEGARGTLATSTKREINRLIRTMGCEDKVREAPVRLKPGTRLVRSWHDKMYQILVLDTGFEFEGRHYASLSQIAHDITGAHWSGPRFFGLLWRGKRKEVSGKEGSAQA